MLYGPAVTAVTERNAGCREVLASYPDIEIHSETGDSGGSRLGGLTCMSLLLPQIDAVFSFNDPTTLGVAQAAKEAGRTEFFIVSVDASPEALRAMADESSLLAATVAQYPSAMAETAVLTALALWRGEDLPKRAISIPVTLVTRDMIRKDVDYWMETE